MSSIGTQLKINVHIDSLDGYRMSDIDFTCDFFIYTNRKITVKKEEMVKVDDDNYIACFDSTKLGVGKIMCRVTACIPDADFENGLRTEIETVDTNVTITRLWTMGCLNVTAKRIGDGLRIDENRVGSGISIQATRIGGISVTCGLVCTVNSQDKILWSDKYLFWLNNEVGVLKYNSLISTKDWKLEEVTIEELL